MGIQTLVYFLMFELAYEFAGLKFDAIYDKVFGLIGNTE